jgi:integrase
MDQPLGFKITRRALDTLGPEARSLRGTWHSDRELKGFYVLAYPRQLSFFVRYRVDGQRRTVKVGDYPALSPEEARRAALAVLGSAARGEDEAARRRAAREAATTSAQRISFAKWREEYVRDSARRLKSTRDPERYLTMAGDHWDRRPLAEITTRDVETLRNRIAQRGSTQANRWLANLRASLTHAVRLGYIEKNPAAFVPLLRENAPRSRTLTTVEETRLREAIKKHEDPFLRVAFTLLLDTGARLSEILRAKREDFDLDPDDHSGTWRIPSPKSGRPQAVPILPAIGAVIAATPQLDNGCWLVPGRNADVHRTDLKKPWAAIKVAAKLGPDVHLHDIRRTFGLRVTRTSGIFAASKLLRHSDSRVTERVYAPLSVEDLRGFAEESAKVVSIRDRRRSRRGRRSAP